MSYIVLSNFGRPRPTLLVGVSDFRRLVAVFRFASWPPLCTEHKKLIQILLSVNHHDYSVRNDESWYHTCQNK